MHIAGFFRITKLSFVKSEHEDGDIYSFYFSSAKPLKHLAGQHGLFILPQFHGLHIFSLSSAPSEEYIRITTHVRQESRYKQYLNNLKLGDSIRLVGPVLDFIYKDNYDEYVFLAQGIGITPFRSLLIEAKKQQLAITTELIHVDSNDHTFRNETEALAGKATYPVTAEEFTAVIGQTLNKEAAYYISGNPTFVKATKRTLHSLGIDGEYIKSDSFLGY